MFILLPSIHVYDFFYGYHFGILFDSQCLSECSLSSTTVDSATREEKAAGYS